MSVEVTVNIGVKVVETLDASAVPAASSATGRKLTSDAFNIANLTLNAASTPAATKHAAKTLTLSSGTGTLDFTALPNGGSSNVDGTGLYVLAFLLANPSTNANKIIVAAGASNGLDFMGANSDAGKIILKPGDVIAMLVRGGSEVIGSGAKNVDVTGTGSQVLQYEFVLGTLTP